MHLVLLALPACTSPSHDDTGDAPPADLLSTLGTAGPWSVGHRDDTVLYADLFAGPATSADRALHLSTWYPTRATSGSDATYFSGAIPAEGIWQDAAPAAGSFPVVVFSHGHQGYAENSSFLMEHLASHGWIVTAPDHTGNTTLDGGDRATEIYAQRPSDLSAVLDWLETSPLQTTPTCVVFGHSFGGYTALATVGATYDPATLDCSDPTSAFCSTMTPALRAAFEAGFTEPRFEAAVIMAPGDFGLFGAAGIATVGVPVFHVTGSEDQGPGSEADDLWAALGRADDRRLVLEGAGHQSFTDFADRMEDVPLSADDGFRILDIYGLAWALRVAGDESGAAVIDGETSVSTDATLSQGRTP